MTDLINQLRRKGRVVVEEHIIEYGGEWMRLRPGDHYLAKHGDEEPQLLTCRRMEPRRRTSGRTTGKVFPKERNKRLYNLEEVIKVIIRTNPDYDPSKKEESSELEQPDTTTVSSDTEGGSTGRQGPDGDGPVEGAGEERVGDAGPDAGLVRPTDIPKPGPRPGPRSRDPRNPSGRTDYTAAARPDGERS